MPMADNGNGSTPALQGKRNGHDNIIPYQFKPGQSGNPKGRPPKTTFLTLAAELDPEGKDLRETYRQLMEAVKNRESWAITLYLDEYLGKPTQRVQHGSDPENPIRIEEVRARIFTRIERHLTSVGLEEGN